MVPTKMVVLPLAIIHLMHFIINVDSRAFQTSESQYCQQTLNLTNYYDRLPKCRTDAAMPSIPIPVVHRSSSSSKMFSDIVHHCKGSKASDGFMLLISNCTQNVYTSVMCAHAAGESGHCQFSHWGHKAYFNETVLHSVLPSKLEEQFKHSFGHECTIDTCDPRWIKLVPDYDPTFTSGTIERCHSCHDPVFIKTGEGYLHFKNEDCAVCNGYDLHRKINYHEMDTSIGIKLRRHESHIISQHAHRLKIPELHPYSTSARSSSVQTVELPSSIMISWPWVAGVVVLSISILMFVASYCSRVFETKSQE